MSHVLAELLGVSEPKLNLTLNRLEAEGGHPNIDVHLISDISANMRRKLKELGLDPHDTTGRELYHSLQLLIQRHDLFLSKVIGANPTDVDDVLRRVRNAVRALDMPSECWALKHSVAKRMLKSHPPKRVMRLLHYKSVDSMLKRERIVGLFAAARITESGAWQEKFLKAYRELQPSDFENRPVEVLLISNPLWQTTAEIFVKKNRHNIAVLNDVGAVVMLPMPVNSLPGVTITVMAMLIRSINELRSVSAFLKLQQVKPNFGVTVAKTLLGNKNSLTVAGQKFPWRVVQQYCSGLKAADQAAIFGPHVQREDLVWIKPEDVLYRLEPALKFWHDMGYSAGRHDKRPISLNLLDNAISNSNQLDYGGQYVGHFREALRSELYLRYLEQTELGEAAFNKLDSALVGSGDFKIEVAV